MLYVGVQYPYERIRLILKQRLYDEPFIMRVKEEGATLALTLLGVENVIAVLDHGQGFLDLIEGYAVQIEEDLELFHVVSRYARL